LLARLSVASGRPGASFAELEQACDRGEALTRRVPLVPDTCLYRCLARYAMFRRHGFEPQFVLAVSPRGVDEDGHAWLEFDGQPYREDRAADFVVSFRYPPRVA
jgi:Transglutaminase-like superfamily